MNVLSLQRIKYSFQYLPKILKQSFFIFIVLQTVIFFFNQVMIYLQEARMNSREDFYVPLIIFLAFIGFLVQTAIKVIWVFVICQFFNGKENLSTYLRRRTEQGLIESLRAFLKSVLYGFLMIIPGVIKMIRYQFVLFIVATSEKYQEGEVDALKTSEKLSLGKTFPLLFLVIVFSVLGLFTTSNELLINKPISVLSMEVVTLCLTTLESLYLYLLFNDLKMAKGIDT